MGTPVACIYAITFFLYYERTILLCKYKKNILFFKCQIDDIIAIWLDDEENPNAWDEFLVDLNSASKLKWTTTPLSNSVDFLDITVKLSPDGTISTKTYQKPMNLFLYIPHHSSHPPGLMKSLIFGLLLTYFLQNSYIEDFYEMVRLLHSRLIARSHKSEDINDIFLEATKSIEERYDPLVDKKKPDTEDSTSDDVIFFHIPYHPRDISRQKIRDIYERTCENPPNGYSFKRMQNEMTGSDMKINRLTIAYSRPQSLRDLLCPSKLAETNDVYVSRYV
jgi:hypothetical protein